MSDSEELLKKKIEEKEVKNKEEKYDEEESTKNEESLKRTRSNTDEPSKEEKTGEEDHSSKKAKTETTDKEGEKKEEVKEDEGRKESKPKFVFGAKTSFGSGFNVTKNAPTDEKDDSTMSSSKPFAFGKGFSFGSGFGVLSKNEAAPTKKDNDETNEKDEKEKSSTVPIESTPSVKLHRQDVKSGEELDECVFLANAKLYQLSDIKEGWKERGVGTLKINKNKNTNKHRILMRSRGILKVILNLPLIKGFSVQKGFPGSLQSEKFVRIIAMDDHKTPVTYALKTGKEETRDELYDNITKSIGDE
ncbi:hypothetical protein KAFR_0B01390 [Kazachstania africana CBS 2517]|uniref:RanBD1 domain-containing protein n=1 Tax=Kazachstania africana (strain ATCC 22294 / BCRC 22015 / CBS 2517 / CECT 1963 / NBRC 1671 / NRRL Y-8276) TaxID=1071382 RepID=H2APY8_KAZAF|nr:hypothetical protein KAFR_0B01390 [Kazachstania africana CBS 2517]CCF56438.1 hypothetical protein KAFR_0B01390 [Kazachstania africana CBS 2517]